MQTCLYTMNRYDGMDGDARVRFACVECDVPHTAQVARVGVTWPACRAAEGSILPLQRLRLRNDCGFLVTGRTTMGLFSKILSKLGIGEKAAETPAAPVAPSAGSASTASAPRTTPDPSVAIPVVNVEEKLEAMAKANPQKLNWRTSIVDLLKLLDLDSSFAARKEMAAELGCPQELMGDSAQMNMWLHKTVLNKIAANGGYLPHDLLT